MFAAYTQRTWFGEGSTEPTLLVRAEMPTSANLVEKTITVDRTIQSVEHIFSLEPDEMKQFVTSIRDVQKALGSPRRVLHVNEKEKRKKIRRSAHLKERVRKGQNVSSATVEFRRPGYGIAPNQFEGVVDLHFKKDPSAGDMLIWSDLE